MDPDIESAVTAASRRGKRLEPPLTKAVSLLLASDAGAAEQFAAIVLSAADPTAVPALPSTIRNEFSFSAGLTRRRGRRGDILLHDDAGTYGLVVEAKLGTQCHRRQIADYLACRTDDLGLDRDARLDFVLLASRALAPHLGSRRSRRRDRWRGCVTWTEVVDDLASVTFDDSDATVLWARLLKHYRHPGGFGTASRTYLGASATLNAGIGRIVAEMRRAGASQGIGAWAEPYRSNSQLVVVGSQARAGARIRITGRAMRSGEIVVTLDLSDRRGTAQFESSDARSSWFIVVPKAWQGAVSAIATDLSERVATGALP